MCSLTTRCLSCSLLHKLVLFFSSPVFKTDLIKCRFNTHENLKEKILKSIYLNVIIFIIKCIKYIFIKYTLRIIFINIRCKYFRLNIDYGITMYAFLVVFSCYLLPFILFLKILFYFLNIFY